MSTLILSIMILPIVGSFSQSIASVSYSKKAYLAIISAENILEQTKHMLKTNELSYIQESENNNSTVFELLQIESFEDEYKIKDLSYTLKINEVVGKDIKNTFIFTDNSISASEQYPKTNIENQVYNEEVKDIEISFDSVFNVLKGDQFITDINDKCVINFDTAVDDIHMYLKVFTPLDYSNITITNNSNFNLYINVFDEHKTSDLSKINYRGNGVLVISKVNQLSIKNDYSILVSVYDKKKKILIKTIGWDSIR